MDGQTVNATYYFPDLSSLYKNEGNKTVGPSLEYPNVIGIFNLNIADTSIIASNFAFSASWNNANFNGFVIS